MSHSPIDSLFLKSFRKITFSVEIYGVALVRVERRLVHEFVGQLNCGDHVLQVFGLLAEQRLDFGRLSRVVRADAHETATLGPQSADVYLIGLEGHHVHLPVHRAGHEVELDVGVRDARAAADEPPRLHVVARA